MDELLRRMRDPIGRMLAFGHVHIPFVRPWRGRLLVNVASAGLPMDGDRRAAYAILTWDGKQLASRASPGLLQRPVLSSSRCAPAACRAASTSPSA